MYVEILGEVSGQSGFDLIVGNPPWIPVDFNEAPVLAELRPRLGVTEARSGTLDKERPRILADSALRTAFAEQVRLQLGSLLSLGNRAIYFVHQGTRTNLYKNFISLSWQLLANSGISGLLHPDGLFKDPAGGSFRAICYRRLRTHLQFSNELFLFADVHHRIEFSVNIYQSAESPPQFNFVSNLYTPKR